MIPLGAVVFLIDIPGAEVLKAPFGAKSVPKKDPGWRSWHEGLISIHLSPRVKVRQQERVSLDSLTCGEEECLSSAHAFDLQSTEHAESTTCVHRRNIPRAPLLGASHGRPSSAHLLVLSADPKELPANASRMSKE